MTSAQICEGDARRNLVRRAEGRNGLDYVEVSDDGKTLYAYFLGKLPSELLANHQGPSPYLELTGGDGHPLHVLGTRAVVDPHPERDDLLEVSVDGPGDFSAYTLRLVDIDGLDPRYDRATFTFGLDCPTDLDCADACGCAPEIPASPEINYLAKDYASFRRLILDRLAVVMPEWTERHAADLGITLVELLAYAGDYLSYYQDAVATEAYLETARQRISVRRHVRLVDYRLSEGCNARTWVCLDVDTDVELPAANVAFATGLNDALPAVQTILTWDDLDGIPNEAYEVFEPLTESPTLLLRAAHSEIRFHTWGRRECHLPAEATSATLLDGWAGEGDGRVLNLQEGDVLIFEEVLGPKTGLAADADPTRRHAVRLTRVTPGEDPVVPDDQGRPTPYVEVEWAWADRLPFSLCLSAMGPSPECRLLENVTVARGNAILVDHGRTLPTEDLGTVPVVQTAPTCGCEGQPGEIQTTAGRFRARLGKTPVTFRVPLPETLPPAARTRSQDPENALPVVSLASTPERPWQVRYDLIGSRPDAHHFAVEIDNEGVGHLRFGNAGLGASPPAGMIFLATYRVGNGERGNVGAEAISRLVLRDFALDGVALTVRNPLPAIGGTEPEPIAEAKRFAPQRFRKRLERAIVAEDYQEIAQRDSRLQRAAARLAWTGSWYEADVAVDPLGRERAPLGLREQIERRLERYRRMGHDLHVVPARYVALDLALSICVKPNYQRGHVKAALMAALGPRGMFHPDCLTFGEGIYLSPIVAAAQEVDGVEAVEVLRFHRFGEPPNGERESGVIPLAHDEIAQCANDPSAPERGRLELVLHGGR